MKLAKRVSRPQFQRRAFLTFLSTPVWTPLLTALPTSAASSVEGRTLRTDQVTILYRPLGKDAPSPHDPIVQSSVRQLEREFIARGLKVQQPSAQLYRLMAQGDGVVVTFASDAGYSLVFSIYRNLRPVPQQEGAIAEVRLESRTIVGRHVLSAESSRGQMFTRTDAGLQEFGARRAFELATEKAASELADKTFQILKAMTTERLADLLGPDEGLRTDAELVGLPDTSPASTSMLSETTTVQPTEGSGNARLPTPKRKWAILVGMSNYSSVRTAGVPGIKDLPGVSKDIQQIRATLPELGFDMRDVTTLKDADATSGALRSALKRLAGLVAADDLVMVYISAHGADKDFSASGFGMPILADFRPNDPNSLDFWELQSLTRNLQGQVVWISDTCHSGGAATNISSVVIGGQEISTVKEVRGPDALSVARATAQGQSFAILTAAGAREISWETGEGGLFTTRLLNALKDNKGMKPLSELFSIHVRPTVIKESKTICEKSRSCSMHPQQTPVMAYGGSGNLIII
ncbi:caspase family protein [Sphaerotilus mobilis]|uniref:Caspase domain-containing protein n=1 Tax=Sphaerotilus mobilis TaxID=47994 RepID=A0A4Q7LQI3_9BURK|nr:caspase family protein [Sphaerotilus mobilis]RZS57125.1 caspase domain-containing protein [Sphaerotilus mobilis]